MNDLFNKEPSDSSFPLTEKLDKEIIRRISFSSVSYKRILDYHYEKMMIQVFRKISNHDGQYFSNQCHSIDHILSRREAFRISLLIFYNKMLAESCQISKVNRCESNKIDRQEEEGRGWIFSVDVDTGNKSFRDRYRYQITAQSPNMSG